MSQVAMAEASSASAEAIQFHYDVGTDFYRLWLDRECIYSCALWRSDVNDLERAQIDKLDYVLSESRIAPGERLLDVGCGWGAMLRRAVSTYRAREAVGLTLARTQAEYIMALPPPGVAAMVEHWLRHTPARPYDAIVSVGAFEHFAKPGLDEAQKVQAYRAFFERCSQWLAPERRLVLQTITYESASATNVNPFLRDQIFPESELPHFHEIVAAAKGLFEVVAVRGDREHYARTLDIWGARLKSAREAAGALVGAETVARYERYLKLARLGFLSANLGLMRVTFQKLRYPRAEVAPRGDTPGKDGDPAS